MPSHFLCFVVSVGIKVYGSFLEKIRDYFTSYRRPGTISWYAASPFGQYVWRAPAGYHKGVTSQLAILGRQTGDPAFATQSALLKADYS